MTLSVTMPGQAQTRVAYDGGTTNALKWQKDDQLIVSRANGRSSKPSTFTLATGIDGQAATFTVMVNTGSISLKEDGTSTEIPPAASTSRPAPTPPPAPPTSPPASPTTPPPSGAPSKRPTK